MKLKQIKLYNFRQFYGENTLDFSTDLERNVTLVHGENGVGKTTLLNAIKWCFFGELTEDFENPEELVCNQALKEGQNTCRVEIRLVHENKEYHVLRSFDVKTKTAQRFNISEVVDYNFKDIPNPKNLMNNILPQDMADYFFFHGEGASALSAKNKGNRFRQAIRDILGFTFAEKAIEDLNSLNSKQSKKIADLKDISSKTQKAARESAILEERLKEERKNLSVIRLKIEESREEANSYDEKIMNSNHLVAQEKKNRLNQLESELMRLQADLKRENQEKQSIIQKYGWSIFGRKLANQGLNFIDEESLKGRIPSPYDETLVNDLISTKKCICGRDLLEGTLPYIKILSLRETANSAIITQKLSKARSFASKTKGLAVEFLDAIDTTEQHLVTLHKAIGVNLQHQSELNKELDNLKDADSIKDWQYLSRWARKMAEDGSRKQGAIEKEIITLEREIERVKKEVFQGDGTTPAIQRIAQYQQMLSEMVKRCTDKLSSYEESSKIQIAFNVNNILEQFSRKDYRVRLSQNYEFYLIREDGKKVAKSKGENLLLNLSFISALIKLASERSSASGSFLISGTVAPFVIDAPFGELDETYKAATASFLPTNSEQLILFLSSSHWKGTVDLAIRSKVGKEYLLVSERVGNQGSKPSDKIEINGVSYSQSLYSQEKDRTSIQEVKL
ncbi:MAG: AAA family ATPase [Candidatus Thiothrix moscowensis]|nr:AAA family ATPase [Candidatus Thiothrix moscowensis]